MATKQVKFTDLKVGEAFYAEGGNGYEQYKKISDLEYQSIANGVLGSFYTTSGFMVEPINAPAVKKAVKAVKPIAKKALKAVKPAVKKAVKKAGKR